MNRLGSAAAKLQIPNSKERGRAEERGREGAESKTARPREARCAIPLPRGPRKQGAKWASMAAGWAAGAQIWAGILPGSRRVELDQNEENAKKKYWGKIYFVSHFRCNLSYIIYI